jgi:hypothetical protein
VDEPEATQQRLLHGDALEGELSREPPGRGGVGDAVPVPGPEQLDYARRRALPVLQDRVAPQLEPPVVPLHELRDLHGLGAGVDSHDPPHRAPP